MFKMTKTELLEKFGEPIQVLDHGIVQLIDVMGDDQAVLQAARTSTGSGSKGEDADRSLLRYLFRHKHATPFEAANIKLFVKLPIFVERQWVRHRASWLSEVSARYTQLPAEFYIPDPDVRPMAQSKSNKQGSSGSLPEGVSESFLNDLNVMSKAQHDKYQIAIDSGVAKEIARLHLGVNVYTQKLWGTSLRMLMHMLALRCDPHAQWEIRQYANIICEILEAWCPWTCEAFSDYELNAHTFSAQEMEMIRYLVSERALGQGSMKDLADRFNIGSNRERRAFWTAAGLLE